MTAPTIENYVTLRHNVGETIGLPPYKKNM